MRSVIVLMDRSWSCVVVMGSGLFCFESQILSSVRATQYFVVVHPKIYSSPTSIIITMCDSCDGDTKSHKIQYKYKYKSRLLMSHEPACFCNLFSF